MTEPAQSRESAAVWAAFKALPLAEQETYRAAGLAGAMAFLDRMEAEGVIAPPPPPPVIRMDHERGVYITDDGAEHQTVTAAINHLSPFR